MRGFEPPTFPLRRDCSTIKATSAHYEQLESGGTGETRTRDLPLDKRTL